MPPRDRQAAELVQAPLDYPGIDDYAADVLASGVPRQARRSPASRPRVAQVDPPKGARTLTPEQQVGIDDLDVLVVVGVASDDQVVNKSKDVLRAPSGAPLTVVAQVNWKNEHGQQVPWSDSRIRVRYGAEKEGNVFTGRGPHVFRPVFEKRSVVVEVELWSEKRKRWERVKVYVQDVQAYCSVDMTDLTEDQHHMVATLFAEGGERTDVTEDELTRIAWCMKDRLDLVRTAEATARANPTDRLAQARWNFVRVTFGGQATFAAVLTKSQFYGVGEVLYHAAKEPAAKIANAVVCRRLQFTKDLALDVIAGVRPNPHANQGNAAQPGVFYYMTKDRFEEHTRYNAQNPGKKHKFAPTWPKLPGQPSDVHWYWGLEPAHPFKP